KAFGSVSQETEVTHAHETFGDHVEQEAADEFVGIKGHGLFSVFIFSVPVTEGNVSVTGGDNPIIGERHAVGVAAEVVQHMGRRSKRFFGIDDPWFFSQCVDQEVKGHAISQASALTDKEELVSIENLFESVQK